MKNDLQIFQIIIIRFFGESLFHVLALKLAHQKIGALANHKEGKNGSGSPFS